MWLSQNITNNIIFTEVWYKQAENSYSKNYLFGRVFYKTHHHGVWFSIDTFSCIHLFHVTKQLLLAAW